MKTYYQMCVLVALVFRAHSGPVPPSTETSDEELAKVRMDFHHAT